MKEIFRKFFDYVFNFYTFFYFSLFLTDYSFLLKKRISNISGFTAFFIILLILRRLLDKRTFGQLFLFRLLRQISRINDKAILFVIFILITCAISALGIARHLSLGTTAWDMGIFDQAIWNTLRGDILFSSIRGNINLLADHFEPILFFLVPFYALWPHVFTLITIQALMLALSVFPLYLIAKDRLNNRLLIFAFVVSFALSRALRGIGLSDFHPEGFMVFLSFSAFYFLIKKRNLLFFFMILLLLSCKETTVFIVLGLGFYALLFLKKRLIGVLLIVAGVTAWIWETKFIIPFFNNYNSSYLFYERMPFGATYQENLQFIFRYPVQFIKFLFMPGKITYYLKLSGAVGFLPIFAPSQYILIALSSFVVLFAPGRLRGYFLLSSHYVAQVLPFIYISAIYGTGNIINFIRSRPSLANRVSVGKLVPGLAAYIVVFALFSYGKTDAYKLAKSIKAVKGNNALEKISYLSFIPNDASVSATSSLVPHLSHRKYIYDWDLKNMVWLPTDYLVLDFTLDAINKEKAARVFEKIARNGYKKIFSNTQGDFYIFLNPSADRKQIENFHQKRGD